MRKPFLVGLYSYFCLLRWNLVTVDEFRLKGLAPKFCHTILKSPIFLVLVMSVTMANAIVTATISFQHFVDENENSLPREHFFQWQKKAEVCFVIFYNFEALFKIFCLSFKGYISSSIHKFEFLLAIMTTIHVLPYPEGLFLTPISIFQVLRVVRLVKASPMLEDFVYKIFGPGKKLSSLIMFTIHLLLITSCIAMQLFCNLKDDDARKGRGEGRDKKYEYYANFSTFPYALMSMFQILTQEAWPEVSCLSYLTFYLLCTLLLMAQLNPL